MNISATCSLSMELIFYVYVYLDHRKPGKYNYGEYTFDYEPFYVGKGHDEESYGGRKRSHIHLEPGYQKRDPNTHKTNKIKKIKRETGNNPIIVKVNENMIEKDAFELEICLIATIGRYDKKLGPLTNMTDGGDGCKNVFISEQKKKNHSERMKGSKNPMYGRERTFEEKEKISKGKIGKYTGPNSHMYGKHHSDEQKHKSRVKHQKYMYKFISPSGEIFENVISLTQFAKLHNLQKTSLLKIVRGEQYHTNGWIGYIVGQENLRKQIEEKRLNPKKRSKEHNDKLTLTRLKYDYVFISPKNEIFHSNNLNKFCRDKGLSISHMNAVVLGKKRNYKSWIGHIIGKENLRDKYATI